MKSLTFSCLICALNLYLLNSYSERQNLLEAARAAKRFLQTSKVCQKLPITIGKVPIGGKRKSKRAGKNGAKKSKERGCPWVSEDEFTVTLSYSLVNTLNIWHCPSMNVTRFEG